MSTKVYDGFKLADIWNDGKLETFERFCNEVKLIVEKVYNKEWCLSQKKYNKICELNKLNDESYNEDPWELNKDHNPLPEMCFYFFEGKVYGSLFHDNYGIRKVLLEGEYIKDFAYWDNTDPDEEVSEEEWDERERVWDSIDHWQVSIQWQDYLMRSGYYMDEEDHRELNEQIDETIKKTENFWVTMKLADYIARDKMTDDVNNRDLYTYLNYSSEAEKNIKDFMSDGYSGKYKEERDRLLNIVKQAKEKE